MQTPTIIIQARTGSTRMPRKVILPFWQDKCLIEILLENLLQLNLPVVLATTVNPIDDPLAEVARKYPLSIFRGSENNVLERFIGAAETHRAQTIVRVCADNPFLDAASVKTLVAAFQQTPSDYLSFQFSENRPSIKTHFGFFTEVTTLETLKKVASATSEKLYLEHVTNFIYGNPSLFNVRFLDAPSFIFSRKDIRLTLDTPEDFALHQKIFAEMKAQNPTFGTEEVVAYLDQHPEILQIMKSEIDKNSK